MARSFTVPQTLMRPMSPPGKKMGWTTWESVVTTSHWSPTRSAAPSSSAAEADAVHRRGQLEEDLLDELAHGAPARPVLEPDLLPRLLHASSLPKSWPRAAGI